MDVDNSSTENVNSSFLNLNTTLVDLDETPSKTVHMPTSTKITKGKQKLASATRTLKRKLELSYEVSLYSSDSDDEQCAKDYQRYHLKRNDTVKRKVCTVSELPRTCTDTNILF